MCCGAIPGEQEQVRNTIRELLLGYEEEITELLYESREIKIPLPDLGRPATNGRER